MKVIGLSKNYFKYSFAYIEYFATGEGITIECEILNEDQLPSIGGGSIKPDILPLVNSEVLNNQKYCSWNSKFRDKFLSYFGSTIFFELMNCCEQGGWITFKTQLHYNLS